MNEETTSKPKAKAKAKPKAKAKAEQLTKTPEKTATLYVIDSQIVEGCIKNSRGKRVGDITLAKGVSVDDFAEALYCGVESGGFEVVVD